MPTLTITTRTIPSGAKRFVVRYRLGGRAYPLVHGGSFKTLSEAQARRDLIASELAAGRNPSLALHALRAPKTKRTTAEIYASWKASRIDLDARTLANCDFHWKRLDPVFGGLAPDEITYLHVRQWISDNAQGEGKLSPKVLRDYAGTLKRVLDYSGVEPNPARDRRVRFPRAEYEITVPPSDEHVLAMLAHMPRVRRLFYIFLEQDGGRIGEHIALTWADVDNEGSRILARPEAVKGRRDRRKPRWLQIPEWLLELLLDTCPPGDRHGDRPLFPWLHEMEHPRQAANKTMANACKTAGIPHFHPHDLRQRRILLWHSQGIPAREIAGRVGLRKIAVNLEAHTHVMPLDEVPESAFVELYATP